MNKKEIRSYFSETEKLIICDRKKKKSFMSDFKISVMEYIDGRDDVTKEELLSVFGTPEEIAGGFIQNMDAKAIKRSFSIKKAVIAVLITAVVIYAFFIAASLIDVHTEAHGYFEEEILIISGIAEEVILP